MESMRAPAVDNKLIAKKGIINTPMTAIASANVVLASSHNNGVTNIKEKGVGSSSVDARRTQFRQKR